MRNAKERAEFIADPKNWKVVEQSAFTRVLRIEYKGEYRYKVQVYKWTYRLDLGVHDFIWGADWTGYDYYKKHENPDSLEQQSLTEIRAWVAELDKKDKEEEK